MASLRIIRRSFGTGTSVTYLMPSRPEIARIDVTGVVTPLMARRVLETCQQDLVELMPLGLVAYYADAALAIDARDLVGCIKDVAGRRGALHMPTALVVAEDALPLWRDYAWLAADVGLLRGLFTSAERAEAWLAGQVQVRQQELVRHAAHSRTLPTGSSGRMP